MKYNSNTRNMVDGKKFKIASLAVALSALLANPISAGENLTYDGNNPLDTEKLDENWLEEYSLNDKKSYTLYSKTSSSNNQLDLRNLGVVIERVYGGKGENADNNSIIIDEFRGEYLYGGYGTNETGASNNTVHILGDVQIDTEGIKADSYDGIFGGRATDGSANNNIVVIDGNVTNTNVTGGKGFDSARKKEMVANYNTVIIKGDLIHDKVRWPVFVIGGESDWNASNNTVTLEGDIQGHVFGGKTWHEKDPNNRKNVAINNTVNITANKEIGLKEKTYIYGGFGSNGDRIKDNFTGNTLNFSGYTLQAKTIANFEHYNFTLDPRLVNTDTASITAEEIRLGNGRTGDGAEKSQISVVDIKKGNLLYVNDRFVLMDSDKAFEEGSAEIVTGSTVGQQGISILYEIETIIDYENGKVTAVVKKGAGANPQLKSLSEGHLASLMQLTRAADMVAYEALDTIKAKNNGGLSTFFKFGGGHSRYDSGSHIKANDYHIMAGVSLRDEALTAAAFVEGGWGNYDTHNSFQGLGLRDVNGDGKNRYIGVGVIGQYDFADGLYVDGSFRIGSSHNKFNAVGLRNETEAARYSFSRTYVSAHAGLGYLYDLDDKNAIDFSAKYLWTHIGGKTLSVAGEKIKFNSLDSNRIRLSATWNHQYSDSTKFKAGAGYEYEFSAKAKGTALDIYSIDAPKVKGGTGILTLGMNVNPEANKNVDIDFNINGYAGKRDGVSASIKVSYNF